MDKVNASSESWIRRICKAYVEMLKRKKERLGNEAVRTVTAFNISTEVPNSHTNSTIQSLKKSIDRMYNAMHKLDKRGFKFDGMLPRFIAEKLFKESNNFYSFSDIEKNEARAFDAEGRRNRTAWGATLIINFIILVILGFLWMTNTSVNIFLYAYPSLVVIMLIRFFGASIHGFLKEPSLLKFVHPDFFLLKKIVIKILKHDKGPAMDNTPEVLFQRYYSSPHQWIYLAIPSFPQSIKDQIKLMLKNNLEPYLILDKRDIKTGKTAEDIPDEFESQYGYLVCVDIPVKEEGNKHYYTGILTGLPDYDKENRILATLEEHFSSY